MSISQDLGRIWLNEVFVDRVYDHTRPSTIVYISSMQVYIHRVYSCTYLYSTIVVF
jgi:hypothetical protein